MSTLARLAQAIDMLNRNEAVSMATFKRELGVTDRAVYRYIDAMRKASMPVFYDADKRGYRLKGDQPDSEVSLTVNDRVILLLALSVLSNTVSKSYREDITELEGKLWNQSAAALTNLSDTIANQLNKVKLGVELTPTMTSVILSAAMELNKVLRVDLSRANHWERFVEVGEPRMVFANGWKLADNDHEHTYPVEDVDRALIIEDAESEPAKI